MRIEVGVDVIGNRLGGKPSRSKCHQNKTCHEYSRFHPLIVLKLLGKRNSENCRNQLDILRLG